MRTEHTDRPREPIGAALDDGRRRAGERDERHTGPQTVLALQRHAGNAAVSALIAGKLRSPGAEAVSQIDRALTEVRRDEPEVDTVEKGLQVAKAAGVPVELEGPKPPASALAVNRTGFGPASVAPNKPVPPKKPLPGVNPLAKVSATAPAIVSRLNVWLIRNIPFLLRRVATSAFLLRAGE